VIPKRAPIKVSPGDVVNVGDHDTNWPAFVFVTTLAGQGWVPARHLAIDGRRGVVGVAYDTTELPTTTGERLQVVRRDDESGWLWCRKEKGEEGWVPTDTVDETV
jgi:hypothetical protein